MSADTTTTRGDMLVLAALSVIAGVTDVTSWLLLGGFFSAHITGNLVVIAADVVTHSPTNIAAVLSIPTFVIVTAIATVVARSFSGAGHAPARAVTVVLLGAQTLLLAVAAVLSFLPRMGNLQTAPLSVVIGLFAVGAMASQNAYLHLVPMRAAPTAVMTGNLVSATIAGIDFLMSRGRSVTARPTWRATWPLLAGFVVGCLIGAGGAALFHYQAAVIPAVLSLLLFGALFRRRH